MCTVYYAHTKAGLSEDHWQSLKLHLKNVSDLAADFAEIFDCAELGRIIGLFHDLGKYSREFQARLRGLLAKVNHSTAGGYELSRLLEMTPLGGMLAYAILGHHGGLPDCGGSNDAGSLKARLKVENIAKLPDYSCFKNEFTENELKAVLRIADLPQCAISTPKDCAFSFAFLIRMLFSCLVDADWLDTERFMSDNSIERGNFAGISTLYSAYELRIADFGNPQKPIDVIRNKILRRCLEFSTEPKGLFTLTVPTGGGKTLASLGFALKHAKERNLRRVIYAIPYTSIIEQTARVFRGIVGEDNVLEHHSNYVFESQVGDEEPDSLANRLKLAAQNWDIPIVVTTNVQFFESMFSNKPAQCRKLHNIAGSVIILDEAQMLPVDYLSPCVRALEELVRFYDCTVVLCSATQPALDKYMQSLTAREIMENPGQLEQEPVFRRVRVHQSGMKSDAELASEIMDKPRSLTIVNTKRHAKELYHLLHGAKNLYHLSTFMCPAHRKEKLKEIKALLLDGSCPDVRVISTQLIEAGVDVDFPVVYRSAAGIDSIVQSAGRCNRNGLLEYGEVVVFSSTEAYGRPRGYLQRTAQIGESIAEAWPDVISAAAVSAYFERLYRLEQGDRKHLDTENILDCFAFGQRNAIFNYKTCSQKFNLIANNTHSAIIPFDDEARKLIEELRLIDFPRKLLRQLQPYTVSLFARDFAELQGQGLFEDIGGISNVLIDMKWYDDGEGLLINKESEAMFV